MSPLFMLFVILIFWPALARDVRRLESWLSKHQKFNGNRRTDLDFYVENLIKEFPVYAALRQRLLQIGGNEISIGNEDIQKRRRSKVERQQAAWLVANGKESDGEADLWKGLPGECYANVAMLFFLSRQLEVWSGWALAPDYHLTDSGIWTEHCWGRYQGR